MPIYSDNNIEISPEPYMALSALTTLYHNQ